MQYIARPLGPYVQRYCNGELIKVMSARCVLSLSAHSKSVLHRIRHYPPNTMKKWLFYTGMLLCVLISGCSSDPIAAGDADVVVTVRGSSAFGAWERAFVGPETDAPGFTEEAVSVVHAVAEKFEGAIEVEVSVGDQVVEAVSIEGNDEDIVQAAILAAHDITALRLGFLPKGSIDDLNVPGAKAGSLPCTCVGAGCCCTWDSCMNIYLACDNCKGRKDYCISGTECWFGREEEE